MTPIHVFWTEPTGRVRRYYRCYEHPDRQDPESKHYCDASRPKDEVADTEPTDGDWENLQRFPADVWPTKCDECGRPFIHPTRQIFRDELYAIRTGPRKGEIIGDRKRPVGAMRDLTWLKDVIGGAYTGPDGIALGIQLPDGEFYVDSQCSNCTMNQYLPMEPNELGRVRRFVRTHYCWQREGDPRTGTVNVGKINPLTTCAAGAGSIWQNMPKGFHGFVYRGFVCEGSDFQAINQLLDAGVQWEIPVVTPTAELPRAVPPVVRTLRVPARGWRSNRGFSVRPKH